MPKNKKANPKKSVGDVFAKIQATTGIDKKKVDTWREKWLAVPKNRTKYEGIKNAPDVMGEEMFAMFNDIVEFAEGEEGGKSQIFNKLKAGGGDFLKHPIAFLQKKAEEGKKKAMEMKAMAEKKAGEVKAMAEKKAGAVKKAAEKKVKK